jgi:hypothetical protein
MAPDGQVRRQASGIRLDHSLTKPPSSLSLFFAGGVTRRRLCDGLELKSDGGSGGPTSVCSDQLFDACGPSLCWTCLTGARLARRSLATSSIAQLSERLRARQKVRVEVPELHQYEPLATRPFAR